MQYTFLELLFLFFLYSFLGWCAEVAFAAVTRKKFINRGVLNGPLCPVYGIGMLIILIFFHSLRGNLFFLFLGSVVVMTVLEYTTSYLLERATGTKWWDYSDYAFHLNGYVCLQFSLLWGAGATVIAEWINPLVLSLVNPIPVLPARIGMAVCCGVLAADALVTSGVILKMHRQQTAVEGIAEGMSRVSNRLGNAIFEKIHKRMVKTVPTLEEAERAAREKAAEEKAKATIFAYGCTFHKIVWLFFLGAFLGDITETIFCYVTSGRLMSRSSVVYGPFSIVWGLGVAMFTMLLYRYRNKDDRYIFLSGMLLGGAYEYICSVFTELVFGTVFWDYSKIPFNLGGRINLLYCFFWGIAAVVWMKVLYPFFSGKIEKVPMKAGKMLTWAFLIFMSVNIVISCLALARYSERQTMVSGKTEGGAVTEDSEEDGLAAFLDAHFPDERMERIYPNAIVK